MKKIYAIIMLTFLVSATATASTFNEYTGDYRPQYSFSFDVFKDLPPFPQDFWSIKKLFDTQEIFASYLVKDYFQPEILPTWNSTFIKIYSTNKTFANQGIFMYPSRFSVYNINKNDSIYLSTLIYSCPGVSTYQGTEIYLDYNDSKINASLTGETIFVLGPTYPVFNKQWMQLLELKITIIDDKGDSVVNIRERDPSDIINDEYTKFYGKTNYSACASLLSEETNRCSIFIYGKDINLQKDTKESNFFINLIFFIFIIILIILAIYYIGHKYEKAKRESSKE
jgi:hypothetical protein